MKMKIILFVVLATTLLLSACGPEAVPTQSLEEIQGTAVAAAMTMVAETQAAIPTATPIPPTNTPEPTPIPTNTIAPLEVSTQQLAVPTQPVAAQPTATTASSADNCDKPLASDPAGPRSPIKIINETKAAVNVSLWLEKTVFGECGYRGYSVPRNNSISIEFPQGNIYGYAWILEPVNKTVSGGPWRPNNTDKWEIRISETGMKFVGP
jgi:hypothetical protein